MKVIDDLLVYDGLRPYVYHFPGLVVPVPGYSGWLNARFICPFFHITNNEIWNAVDVYAEFSWVAFESLQMAWILQK